MTKLTINQLLAAPQATSPSFGAEGDRLAFISNMDGSFQAWEIALADSQARPQRLTHDLDHVAGLSYAPVGPWLCVSHDEGGNEQLQITLLEPASGQSVNLTAGFENARHLVGEWSPDGQSILFAANRRSPEVFDLYRQSVDGSAAELVWQQDERGELNNLRFSPDGKRALALRVPSGSQHDLFEIDLASGRATPLNKPGERVRFGSLYYAADGHSLIGRTSLGSDYMYVARFHRSTGRWEKCISFDWDVTHFTLSKDGQRVAYLVNEGGDSRLFAGDAAFEQVEPAPLPMDLPGVSDGVAWSGDGTRLAFSRSTPQQASSIFTWDLAKGIVEPVNAHQAMTETPSPTAMVAPELVHFPTFDGLEIPAWYYRPHDEAATGEPCPAVVFVHGGPEGQYRPNYDPFAQYMVQRGYAYLATNVRGSSGYGKHYASLDDKRKRLDSVQDLACAAEWLKARPEIDGQRMAVYGRSYGGFMVLASLTFHPQLWAAGVDVVGFGNFVTFLENTSGYRRAHREAEYGTLAEDREFLEKISPLNHIDKIQAPLLVLHGRNDPRVPVSEAEQLVATLRERQMPVRLKIFEDEGHGITKFKNQCSATEAMAAFLDEHIGDQATAVQGKPTGE